MNIKSIKSKRLNKKGQFGGFSIFNIFTFMIVAFIAVILFAGYIWITGQLNTVFTNIGTANEVNAGTPGYTNMSYASQITFGQMNSGIQGLRLVAIALIFSTMLAIVLANFLVKIHPAFFFVYILIVLLAVIFAAPISNAYESLLNSGIYDGGLNGFTGANFILLNLPTTVTVMGILGAILLFVNILRSENEGLPR